MEEDKKRKMERVRKQSH